MATVRLGIEGEYGRRMRRFLEGHLDQSIRLRHFTDPGQWQGPGDPEELMVLEQSFFRKLPEERQDELMEHRTIWISDVEEAGTYYRFHPPDRLMEMIQKETGFSGTLSGETDESCEVVGFFTPYCDSLLISAVRAHMQEGDLYLGMGDMRDSILSGEETGHMGDLCYYIHLKDDQIISRIRELSVREDGCHFLPSAVSFLPLSELSETDYQWFFSLLKQEKVFRRVCVGMGCGMLLRSGLMDRLDRFFLISSRSDTKVADCCEYIMQSVRAGCQRLFDHCEILYREDLDINPDGRPSAPVYGKY